MFPSSPLWSIWVQTPKISILGPSKAIKIYHRSLHTFFKFQNSFLGLSFSSRPIPHQSVPSTPIMPSINSTINNKASIDQTSWNQVVKTTKSKKSKKVTIHQSGSPLPPDDFVLFPQDVVKEKHSSVRDAKPRKPTAPKSARTSSSPRPRHHVIEPKATTSSRRTARMPSERPVCLTHMSTVNCTIDCVNAKPLAPLNTPPKAPSPSRLPTPDVSDLEEDALWSCCGSSWSSLSKESSCCNGKADSMWNEMGASSNSWHQGNRIR